jgi:hypothetical protein
MRTSYFASRIRLLLGLGVAIAVARVVTVPSPPPRSVEGVAMLLSQSVGAHVAPDDFIWEAHSELFVDELWGRNILFLARRGANRDLYRGRVRVTRRGRPIAVASLRELSKTPNDDDFGLVARGAYAAAAMTTTEGVLGVRILDLHGEGRMREAETWLARRWANMRNFWYEGSFQGLREIDVAFTRPPSQVKLELVSDQLVLALGEEQEAASVDVHSAAVNPGPANSYGMSARELRPVDSSPFRVVPQLVAEALGARAGELAQAWARRLVHPRVFAARAPLGPRIAASADGWPPPALASPAGRGSDADGSFHALVAGWLEGAPPAVVTAATRPNRREPKTWVRVVAMDARQVELVAVPGQATPRVEAGPHGVGHVRAGDEVVAVFNGVSPSMGVGAGMIVDDRVFAEPVPERPTFLPKAPGGPQIIRWSSTSPIQPLRQSALESGDDELAERSSICVTRAGHLAYAYGVAARPSDLSAALEAVECRAAMQLASSPGPVGFALVHADGPSGQPDPLDPMMSFPARLFERGSRDDFFAVVRRNAKLTPDLGEGTWLADRGIQPTPSWLTAIHETTVVKLGVHVRVMRLAATRFSYRIRAGTKETAVSGSPRLLTRFESDKVQTPAAAFALGVGSRRAPLGLVIDGAIGLPLRGGDSVARLVAAPARRELRLLGPTDGEPPPGADLSELTLLAEAGKLRPTARELGPRLPRSALCVTEDQTVLVATTTFDSHEATTDVLLDLGCSRVAALDRGARASASVERAMPDQPVAAEHEYTALYAIGASPLADPAD